MQKRHPKSTTTPKPRSTKATSKAKAAAQPVASVAGNGQHDPSVSEEAIRVRAYH